MRAPKVYVVSFLITLCTLLVAGYAQTSNARPAQEGANSQDASPKSSSPGADAATGPLPDAANNPRPGLQRKPIQPGQRVTPANPPASDRNSPLAAPPQSQAAIPQNVLFELFFNNMGALNQVADSDEKAGKHVSAAEWRRYDQKGAGLNDAEGDILRETVLDCLRMLKEQDVKIRASASKDRAQATPGVIGPTPPELIQLVEDRKKIVSDHIESLKEALGDASFNKLDTYVHSSFHAEVIVPKPATPSLSTTGKSQKDNK
jgi:hypothetical protein